MGLKPVSTLPISGNSTVYGKYGVWLIFWAIIEFRTDKLVNERECVFLDIPFLTWLKP